MAYGVGEVTAELAWFVGLTFFGLYEIYALVNRTPHDTLSEAVWRAIYRRPLISFLLGLVVGHFVWQSDRCAEFLR